MTSILFREPCAIRPTVPMSTALEAGCASADAGFLAAIAGLSPMPSAPAPEAGSIGASEGMEGAAHLAALSASSRKPAAPTETREPPDDADPSAHSDLPSTLESLSFFCQPAAAVREPPDPAQASEAAAATGSKVATRLGESADTLRLPGQWATEYTLPHDARQSDILPGRPVVAASLPVGGGGAPSPPHEAQPPEMHLPTPSAPRTTALLADTNIPSTAFNAGTPGMIPPLVRSSLPDCPVTQVSPESLAGPSQGTDGPRPSAPLPAASNLPVAPGVAEPMSKHAASRAEDQPECAAGGSAEAEVPIAAPRGGRFSPAPPETMHTAGNARRPAERAQPDVNPPKDIGAVAARDGRAAGSLPAAPGTDAVKDTTASSRSLRETAPDVGADATHDTFGSLGGSATVADAGAGRAAERAHPHATVHTLPPHLGRHLAETVASFPDRPVELLLSPEELGRVRMTLSAEGGTLALAIQADRPETIDLMRRNIDQLARDFRDLGFTDISFSFGQGDFSPGKGREAGEPGDLAAETDTVAPVAKPATPGRTSRSNAGSGLDLRL